MYLSQPRPDVMSQPAKLIQSRLAKGPSVLGQTTSLPLHRQHKAQPFGCLPRSQGAIKHQSAGGLISSRFPNKLKYGQQLWPSKQEFSVIPSSFRNYNPNVEHDNQQLANETGKMMDVLGRVENAIDTASKAISEMQKTVSNLENTCNNTRDRLEPMQATCSQFAAISQEILPLMSQVSSSFSEKKTHPALDTNDKAVQTDKVLECQQSQQPFIAQKDIPSSDDGLWRKHALSLFNPNSNRPQAQDPKPVTAKTAISNVDVCRKLAQHNNGKNVTRPEKQDNSSDFRKVQRSPALRAQPAAIVDVKKCTKKPVSK
uniref:Uncharacterized protein n=2 Tax=Tetraselmis sp. GSL018 TaxID=582737 RepID=A0A061SJ25_9CHLO